LTDTFVVGAEDEAEPVVELKGDGGGVDFHHAFLIEKILDGTFVRLYPTTLRLVR
jgi:hypothetical protein